MKKILLYTSAYLTVAALPLMASANMYDKTGTMMPRMHLGMMWTHLLGVLVLAVWGVVGVLAAIWLWQHIQHHK